MELRGPAATPTEKKALSLSPFLRLVVIRGDLGGCWVGKDKGISGYDGNIQRTTRQKMFDNILGTARDKSCRTQLRAFELLILRRVSARRRHGCWMGLSLQSSLLATS